MKRTVFSTFSKARPPNKSHPRVTIPSEKPETTLSSLDSNEGDLHRRFSKTKRRVSVETKRRNSANRLSLLVSQSVAWKPLCARDLRVSRKRNRMEQKSSWSVKWLGLEEARVLNSVGACCPAPLFFLGQREIYRTGQRRWIINAGGKQQSANPLFPSARLLFFSGTPRNMADAPDFRIFGNVESRLFRILTFVLNASYSNFSKKSGTRHLELLNVWFSICFESRLVFEALQVCYIVDFEDHENLEFRI